MQDEIVNAEKEQEKFKKVQLHTELGQQVREKVVKEEAEKNERKEFVMTSGGPVMDVEDVAELQKKVKQQQMLVKLNLTKQREMEELERATIKKI